MSYLQAVISKTKLKPLMPFGFERQYQNAVSKVITCVHEKKNNYCILTLLYIIRMSCLKAVTSSKPIMFLILSVSIRMACLKVVTAYLTINQLLHFDFPLH